MREILKTGTLQEVIDTLESGIEEYDMNSIKADSASNDTFLLCDPVVFIPDVNLFAVCMEYCLGDLYIPHQKRIREPYYYRLWLRIRRYHDNIV